MRALLLLASSLPLFTAFPASAEERAPAPEQKVQGQDLAKLGTAERRQLLSTISKEEQAAVLAQLPIDDLLTIGRGRVAELGVYRLKLTKEERVDGDLLPVQVMELLIQPSPLAIRGEVTSGPATGRRLLYNASLRPKELRVKEAGLLGAAGAVWIGLDNRLTRRDTRHPATNLGYRPVMAIFEDDLRKARASGGYARRDEGFGPAGYCMHYTAPEGLKGVYARKARICVDPVELLPTRVEVWDDEGLLERLSFQLQGARVKVDAEAFTPDGAGL